MKQTKRWIYLIAVLAMLFMVPAASAFDGREAESLEIGPDEVLNDDLYFAGGLLVVNGRIEGDLFFIGDTLQVNGTIEGDVIGAANEIIINGTVQDDVMAGGSAIVVADGGRVDGDVLAGGYGVAVTEGATVGGDVLAGAESILLAGEIAGSFLGGATGIEINGVIDGDVDLGFGSAETASPIDPSTFNPNFPASTPRVSAGLNVASGASIGGDFNYGAVNPVDIPEGVVSGETSFSQAEVAAQPSLATRAGQSLWQGVQRWLVIVLIGAVMLHFAPSMIKRPTTAFTDNTGSGLLLGGLTYFLWIPVLLLAIGLLFLIGGFFGMISMDAIGGIVIAVGLVLLAIDSALIILTLVFVANIWAGYLVGNMVMKNVDRPIIPLAAGSFVVVLLGSLPFVGWMIRMVVGIVGLGMLWLWWRTRNETLEKTPDALLA